MLQKLFAKATLVSTALLKIFMCLECTPVFRGLVSKICAFQTASLFPIKILVIFSFLIPSLMGAPCCSGGSSGASMITNDDFARLNVQIRQGYYVGDVSGTGKAILRRSAREEQYQEFQVSYAQIFPSLDYFQFFTNIGARNSAKKTFGSNGQAFSMSDLGLGAAYEYLPEGLYSSWKPKAILALTYSYPLGKSRYDYAESESFKASTGGHQSIGLSHVLLKNLGAWTYSFQEGAKYFVQQQFARAKRSSYWSLDSSLGATFSFWDATLGMSIQPIYTSSRTVSDAFFQGKTKHQWVWNCAANLGWVFSEQFSLSISYLDQTLLGPAFNTALERWLNLGISYHLLR